MAYNDLNSVLLEGKTTATPQVRDDINGAVVMSVPLSSHRQALIPGTHDLRTETTPVTILIVGDRMTDRYRGLEPGTRLRVIGRLANEEQDFGQLRTRRIAIIADHIEYSAVRLGSPAELATV